MQTFKLNSQSDFINEANHKIAIVHTQPQVQGVF